MSALALRVQSSVACFCQAQPKTVENVLKQAYAIDSAVDEELVNYILKPGLEVR